MEITDRQERYQWQENEATNYTHPLDVQLFADKPLFQFLGDISERKIIDIGCGNGYLLRQLHAKGAEVFGIDISKDMIYQAKKLDKGTSHLLSVASADNLPFSDASFDLAICVLTINNFSSTDMVKHIFQETFRVLRSGGCFVITVPHPHTLDAKTSFRWTDWENGQTLDSLIPGEGFQRCIKGIEGTISIINYYWPRQVLVQFATRVGFTLDIVAEETASLDDMTQYSDLLEPIYQKVPFFLVMRFVKNSTD